MNQVEETIYAEDCLASGELFYTRSCGLISPYDDCQEHLNELEALLKATNEKDMIRAVREFQAAQVQYLLKLRG